LEDEHKTVVETNDSSKTPNIWLIAGGVGFIIAVIVTIIFLLFNHYHHVVSVKTIPKVISNACTSPAANNDLQQAAASFNASDVTVLGSVVNNIKELPDYQNDPNCLYVLTMYSVYSGNLTNAKKYLSQFNSLYSNGELSHQLVAVGGVSSLNAVVTGLSNDEKDLDSGSPGISEKIESKK
jgi:hypothetical protein